MAKVQIKNEKITPFGGTYFEFLKAERWDARWTYKGMLGYSPGVAVLTDVKSGEQVIVGVENRDGNANVKFHQEDTLNRILYNLDHSSRANTTYRPITRWWKGGEVLNRREIPP